MSMFQKRTCHLILAIDNLMVQIKFDKVKDDSLESKVF